MTYSLQARIQNAELTKKEKILADYVLENFKECCFFTSTELAAASCVSHTSVLRFVKDLGFSGYSEFQKTIQTEYHSLLIDQSEAVVPSIKLTSNISELNQSSIIESVSGLVQANIQSAIMKNSHQLYDEASDAVIRSKVKYIVGSRGCNVITSFLSVILRHIVPYVFSVPASSGNTFDFLSDIGKEDCLIVSSFARYSKLSLLAAEMAKEAGATIIVLTDKPTAPIAKYADYLFATETKTLTFFNSQVASLFVMEILVTYICKKVGVDNKDKLELINKYISQMELY